MKKIIFIFLGCFVATQSVLAMEESGLSLSKIVSETSVSMVQPPLPATPSEPSEDGHSGASLLDASSDEPGHHRHEEQDKSPYGLLCPSLLPNHENHAVEHMAQWAEWLEIGVFARNEAQQVSLGFLLWGKREYSIERINDSVDIRSFNETVDGLKGLLTLGTLSDFRDFFKKNASNLLEALKTESTDNLTHTDKVRQGMILKNIARQLPPDVTLPLYNLSVESLDVSRLDTWIVPNLQELDIEALQMERRGLYHPSVPKCIQTAHALTDSSAPPLQLRCTHVLFFPNWMTPYMIGASPRIHVTKNSNEPFLTPIFQKDAAGLGWQDLKQPEGGFGLPLLTYRASDITADDAARGIKAFAVDFWPNLSKERAADVDDAGGTDALHSKNQWMLRMPGDCFETFKASDPTQSVTLNEDCTLHVLSFLEPSERFKVLAMLGRLGSTWRSRPVLSIELNPILESRGRPDNNLLLWQKEVRDGTLHIREHPFYQSQEYPRFKDINNNVRLGTGLTVSPVFSNSVYTENHKRFVEAKPKRGLFYPVTLMDGGEEGALMLGAPLTYKPNEPYLWYKDHEVLVNIENLDHPNQVAVADILKAMDGSVWKYSVHAFLNFFDPVHYFDHDQVWVNVGPIYLDHAPQSEGWNYCMNEQGKYHLLQIFRDRMLLAMEDAWAAEGMEVRHFEYDLHTDALSDNDTSG